jgi:monofunctional glycosyltransferase
MRRHAAKIAIGLAAACFALLSYLYLTLPDVRPLATKNPDTTAFIQIRAAEARDAGHKPRRLQRWVRYEAISPNLRKAVLVAEDDAFWQHDGVDVEQMKESIESNLAKGKMARGGSTITQQLAKNLYLSPSRSPLRKLSELLIARRLEAALTKRRIFELYLNEIEWGDGIYGAEAASRAYFGKPASTLSPEEAALLAGAIINPRVHSPAHPTARLRRRQQIILRRMGLVSPPDEAPEAPEPPPPHLQGEGDESTQPDRPAEDATPPIRRPDAQPLPMPAPPSKPGKSVGTPAEPATSPRGANLVLSSHGPRRSIS